MSKAILILNKMPKDCPYCPVAHYNKLDEFTGCDIVGGKRYAMTTEEGYRNTSKRPTWCPLKPLPQKKEIIDIRDNDEDIYEVFANKINVGFNKCIDEILGEEKE